MGVLSALAFCCTALSSDNPDAAHATTGGGINTINGSITLEESDLAVGCPEFDLVFARSYNSASTSSNALGRGLGAPKPLGAGGWAHSFEWTLATVSNTAYGSRAGTFKVLGTGGRSFWFVAETNGAYMWNAARLR